MKQENLKIKTYKISGDSTLLDKQNHITPEVRRIVEEIHPDVLKGRKYLIAKLNKLCRKYPKVPVFKNLLSTIYQLNGDIKQAYAVNQWLVKEHPDYLFGKLNLAAELLHRKEPETIPEILGDLMEISELYPERNEFHTEEVMGFNNISVQYFLSIDEIEQAEERVKIMEDLDEGHPKTIFSKEKLQEWYITRASERMEKEKLLRQNVVVKDNKSHLQTEKPPRFHFPKEIGWLYENDLSIEHNKIKQILHLEEPKLIEDLEKVLHDSIARFDYFFGMARKEGFLNKKLDFPIHALLLLGALKSEASVPAVLNLLKQDRDFNEFWFGDFINDVMDNTLYHCGKMQINLLFQFLKLPNIYEYNKAYVGEILAKTICDSNKERSHFIEQYRDLLNFFIEKADDENYADTEVVGFLISDIADLGYKDLLPEIKQLFDLEIVAFWICGTYNEIKRDIGKSVNPQKLKFIKKDIFEKYNELNNDEEKVTSKADDEYYRKLYEEEFLNQDFSNQDFGDPIEKPKKIGRNELCPCGSGKKYKKCCMNKG